MLQSHRGRILITGWCGRGRLPRRGGAEEHTLVGQLDIEEGGRAARGARERRERRGRGRREWEGSGGWRACAVENYTTGINHRCTAVSLSSPQFLAFPSLSHFFPHGRASPIPHLHSHRSSSPPPSPPPPPPSSPLPFIPLPLPWPWALLEALLVSLCASPSISTSFPLWFVYMPSLLIHSLLPAAWGGFIPPVHGTVLVNLEIDLLFP